MKTVISGLLGAAWVTMVGCSSGAESVSVRSDETTYATWIGDSFSGGGSAVLNAPSAIDGESSISLGRLAVALVNFTDERSRPWSAGEVRDLVFGGGASARAYVEEVSYGLARLEGEVFDWVTIPSPKPDSCSELPLRLNEAVGAIGSTVNLVDYQHLVLVLPRLCEEWDGVGTLGRIRVPMEGSPDGEHLLTVAWINGGENLVGTLIHELGHNLGLRHANGCASAALGAECDSVAYADFLDPMGFVIDGDPMHLGAVHKEKLGWLPAGSVETVERTGEYRLNPYETKGEGTRVIKVPAGDGKYYYIEYRRPIGFDGRLAEDAPAVNGVTIRAGFMNGGGDSQLIDATIGLTPSDWSDSALGEGKIFFDSRARIAVTNLAVGPDGARLRVDLNPPDPVPSSPLPTP